MKVFNLLLCVGLAAYFYLLEHSNIILPYKIAVEMGTWVVYFGALSFLAGKVDKEDLRFGALVMLFFSIIGLLVNLAVVQKSYTTMFIFMACASLISLYKLLARNLKL